MKTIFYDIIETIASDLSLYFYKGNESINNFTADDANYPAIFADMPVRSYISVRQSGHIDVRVEADLIFANKTTELDATGDQHIDITDEMFAKVLSFLDRLQNVTIVDEILDQTYADEFLNMFDINVSGIVLHLYYTVKNPRSIFTTSTSP